MAEARAERRLAAILVADVAGYSRLMGQDEAGTYERLRAHRKELFEPEIERHHGRVFKLTGDGLLAEFASVVEAVVCAVALQRGMAERNSEVPGDQRIDVRIGLHLGDVILEDGDRHGDAVNVAARLETLAPPGGICISDPVQGQLAGKTDLAFEDVGDQQLKNIARPVRVWRWIEAPVAVSPNEALRLPDRPSIAVLPFRNMSSDPELEHFADGLTEDIVTALSHDSSLSVIARGSTSTYKGQLTDVKRIAKELGADYALEGSARRVGDGLQITAQLIDLIGERCVWGAKYKPSNADKFDFQDKIARQIASQVVTQLHLAPGRGTETPDDLFRRAMARLYDLTPDAFAEVASLAEAAIALAPTHARAHVMRAAAFLHRLCFGEIKHGPASVALGLRLAKKAVDLAPQDEYAH